MAFRADQKRFHAERKRLTWERLWGNGPTWKRFPMRMLVKRFHIRHHVPPPLGIIYYPKSWYEIRLPGEPYILISIILSKVLVQDRSAGLPEGSCCPSGHHFNETQPANLVD